MPTWLDAAKTLAALSKCPCHGNTQFAMDKFLDKVEKHYHEQRYKAAFKEVQQVLKTNQSLDQAASQPKKGKGICTVIEKVTEEYLNSLNDMKISRGAIKRALLRLGNEVSLLKIG